MRIRLSGRASAVACTLHLQEGKEISMDVGNSRGGSVSAGDTAPLPAQQRAPRRSKFAVIDDVVLLRAANDLQPWRAPVGTAFGVMKVFEEIAAQCAKDKDFGVQKGGPALRTRFVSLLNQYKSDGCQSMRQAGTSTQFQERERLLKDITRQMDDWDKRRGDEDKEEPSEAREEAPQGLENRVTRQAILASAEEEEEKEEGEKEEDEGETHDAEEDGEEERNAAVSVASDQTDARSVTSTTSGRAAKRLRLDSVTDALVSAIAAMRDTDNRKIDFEIQKLTFDREMAERQRQHEREESARRRQHELALEERRMALEQRRLEAEEARELRMHEFILKLLDQQKKK